MFGHIQLVIVYNIHHINGACDHKLLLNSKERNPEGGEDIKLLNVIVLLYVAGCSGGVVYLLPD